MARSVLASRAASRRGVSPSRTGSCSWKRPLPGCGLTAVSGTLGAVRYTTYGAPGQHSSRRRSSGESVEKHNSRPSSWQGRAE